MFGELEVQRAGQHPSAVWRTALGEPLGLTPVAFDRTGPKPRTWLLQVLAHRLTEARAIAG